MSQHHYEAVVRREGPIHQIKTNKKYVLTGGPSSGKTSIIYGLETLGVHTINEVAHKYISYQQAKGIKEPWRDPMFETNLYKIQYDKEQKFKHFDTFMDRSLIDIWVYGQTLNQEVPKHLHTFIDQQKYDKKYDLIFDIEPLENYKKEKFRREDKDEAIKMGNILKNFYKTLGYNVISVPDLGVEKRIDFILNECEKYERNRR